MKQIRVPSMFFCERSSRKEHEAAEARPAVTLVVRACRATSRPRNAAHAMPHQSVNCM